MSFEEYRHEVSKALHRWADAVFNGSRSRAADLKEDAEGLISSWKETYPHKKQEISGFVRQICSQRFD